MAKKYDGIKSYKEQLYSSKLWLSACRRSNKSMSFKIAMVMVNIEQCLKGEPHVGFLLGTKKGSKLMDKVRELEKKIDDQSEGGK